MVKIFFIFPNKYLSCFELQDIVAEYCSFLAAKRSIKRFCRFILMTFPKRKPIRA